MAVSATSIADILFAGKLVAVDCYHKESGEAYGLYLVDSRKYPMGYPFFVSALASLVGAWLLDEKNPGNTPFAFLCGFLGIIFWMFSTLYLVSQTQQIRAEQTIQSVLRDYADYDDVVSGKAGEEPYAISVLDYEDKDGKQVIIYRLDKTIEEYHIQFCLLPDFSYRVIYD